MGCDRKTFDASGLSKIETQIKSSEFRTKSTIFTRPYHSPYCLKLALSHECDCSCRPATCLSVSEPDDNRGSSIHSTEPDLSYSSTAVARSGHLSGFAGLASRRLEPKLAAISQHHAVKHVQNPKSASIEALFGL